MKLPKKIGLAIATALALLTLTACASSGANTRIITMKGDYITVTDMYNAAKLTPNQPVSTILQNLAFNKIFTKDFGSQVTDKDVQAKFDQTKNSYPNSSSFDSALQQQGLTEASYKATLRTQLLTQAAINAEVKKSQLTTANYEAAFKNYHPEVDAYIAQTATKDDADKTRDAAINQFSSFAEQAKQKNLEQKFDSSNTTIPVEVQNAAFALQTGETSQVIPEQGQDGTTVYFVVYMINNPGKGSDWTKYKTQLTNIIETQKQQDQTFVQGVIKGYLTKYNVVVKEQAFSNIFSNFASTTPLN